MPKLLLVLTLLLVAGACAPVTRPPSPDGDCLALLQTVDRAVAAADCRNAAYTPLPDTPYLRTSRFWASYARRGDLPPGELDFVAGQLRRLDAAARSSELACLPPAERSALEQTTGGDLAGQLNACGDRLLGAAEADPAQLRRILAAACVPDDYRTWRRVVGLYPLVSIPFRVAVANAYAERRDWYRQDLDQWLQQGTWQSLAPAAAPPAAPAAVAQVLAAAAANPLQVPLPDADQGRWLARNFAPVLVQQQATAADHWGRVARTGDGIVINGTQPLVYWYLDHLFDGPAALLRVNYVLWYPQRNGEVTPWLERGRYDGLTIGVTLAANGRPLLVETLNNCGCYHQFFPGADLPPPLPVPFAPDPLVPQTLPALSPGNRLAVYVIAGWHQVIRLGTRPAAATAGGDYGFVPYRELEQLPGPDGRVASLFDEDGILPGSERVERWFFFSMGIPSVGSMRQRGHLPITLLGREHYDDPQLLQHTFGLPLTLGTRRPGGDRPMDQEFPGSG